MSSLATRERRGEPVGSSASAVLEAARSGDEKAFEQLVEEHRASLHAHCYRMLRSRHDAEDALQEALLRAWRAMARFEGRGSVRSWLYRIGTNTCLDQIARRRKRVLLHGPPADGADALGGEPLHDEIQIEPYPDEQLGDENGHASPAASYEQREAVELAFIAALQHLPPRQRAALILHDVFGLTAREVAGILDASLAAVNSLLQRARSTLERRNPERGRQVNGRAVRDDRLADIERFIDALAQGDLDSIVALLTEDVRLATPPGSDGEGR